MIRISTLFIALVVGSFSVIQAQAPVIDGVYNAGEGWMLAGQGDANAGWAGATAKKLYAAFDGNYAYFGAEVKADDWMQYIFVVNTKDGGGSTDAWGRTISYNHANKPDYLFRGDIGKSNYSEWHAWNGTQWTGTGTAVNGAGTEAKSTFDANRDGFIEIRVPRSIIGFPGLADIQFVITGNNGGEQSGHGNFDSAPTDNVSTSWNAPGNATSISIYASPAILPATLAAFAGEQRNGTVQLSWKTLSETNLAAFDIEQSTDGRTWARTGSLKSKEARNGSSYDFAINRFTQSFAIFRLKLIGKGGEVSYSNQVTIKSKANANIELIGNPARGAVKVGIHQSKAETITGELLNMQGGRISTVHHNHGGGSSVMSLSVSGLAAGNYLMRVTTGDGAQTMKVIVQ